ncbi:unnamed protein product, partial [Rotaria sordida]
SFRCSIDKNDDEQRIISKGNIESGFIASSGNFVLSNKNSNDEQTQTIRKFYRHHRSSFVFNKSKKIEFVLFCFLW